MKLDKLFTSFVLVPSLFLFNHLDPIQIVSQNDHQVILNRKNKKLDELLINNNLIFFGENHDQLNDKIQLEIFLDHLRDINKEDKLSLGLEMVTSDKQIILDQFNNDLIDSDELIDKLNWKETWYYLPEGYKLIFDTAKHLNINLIGLNSPERVTQLFKQGLSFNKDFIDSDNLISFLKGINSFHSLSDKKAINKYYQINLLWESWMSSEIENYFRLYPESKMIVFTGTQHSKNEGIPKILNNMFNNKFEYINLSPYQDTNYFGKIESKKNDII